FSYNRFDFSFLITGVGKSDIWPYINLSNRDDVNKVFWPYSDLYSSLYKHQLDYWPPENRDAYYMRSYSSGTGNTTYSRNVQTKYLLNGAYIRLRNVELGYTMKDIPFISQVRYFISIENPFKVDHLPKGMDSEVSTTYN